MDPPGWGAAERAAWEPGVAGPTGLPGSNLLHLMQSRCFLEKHQGPGEAGPQTLAAEVAQRRKAGPNMAWEGAPGHEGQACRLSCF